MSAAKERPLTSDEAIILLKMLAVSSFYSKYSNSISNLRVVTANDGGMGSLIFIENGKTRRTFGQMISQQQFHDADGVLVLISLHVDDSEKLLSMDFWKVDFSRLNRYPMPEQLESADIITVPPRH
ncbi:MAG TPA: hypothetical protein VM689_03355 [Aliidongia sp.]|nr:hypothetical protein [Aliidongia sp.]